MSIESIDGLVTTLASVLFRNIKAGLKTFLYPEPGGTDLGPHYAPFANTKSSVLRYGWFL
jgi:hypothetical protein